MTIYTSPHSQRRRFLQAPGREHSRRHDPQDLFRPRGGNGKASYVSSSSMRPAPDGCCHSRKNRKAFDRMEETIDGRTVRGNAPGRHRASRARASTPTTTRTGCTIASAAIRRFSIPRPSSSPAPAGPASGSRSRKKMSLSRATTRTACNGTRCCAPAATLIWGMFSTMVRRPRTCATA